MTALTLYVGDTATTSISTAASLVTTSGGTATTHASACTGSTGYGEIVFLSTTSAWGAAGSAPAPDGQGALWDVTTLEGQTLTGGTFTFKYVLATVGTSSSVAASIIARLYKWKSGPTYTSIGSVTLTGQTINTTLTSFTLSGSFSSMAFSTGEKLYHDLILDLTSNTSATKIKSQMGGDERECRTSNTRCPILGPIDDALFYLCVLVS